MPSTVYFYAPGFYPQKKHNAAAYDLFCVEDTEILAHETKEVPTGVRVAFPLNVAGLVLPRSSWRQRGIVCIALFDPGYDGEINPIVTNLNPRPLVIQRGQRFAQLLFVPVLDVVLFPTTSENVTFLNSQFSERGSRGKGSTGV